MERTMRRIVLLWLVLTPLWIAFSFYASVSKIAFIPPALVVIALVLHWLHKQIVRAIAGEPEPRASPQLSPSSYGSSYVPPVAAPSRGFVRPVFIAAGVGACIGAAAVPFFHLDRPAHSMTARATQPAGAISVQTEAVKPQSFGAELKAVQTEAVESQSFAAEAKMQNTSQKNSQADSTAPSSRNADAKRAEAQISTDGQISSNQPRCNVSLCESYYQSFRASDCTYQPYSGPRQYCAR
jgi:BA14K-like protein